MALEYKKPIIGSLRSGKTGDEFVQITDDVKTVYNGYVKLNEIPDEIHHVTITSVASPYQA